MNILNILETDVTKSVEKRKEKSLGKFPNKVVVPMEIINDSEFDIHDCKVDGEVKCTRTAPDRAATYINSMATASQALLFIKYEDFLNQFRLDPSHDWAKDLNRVDYIVVVPESKQYFILHEVSLGEIKNKREKAKNQFIGTLKFLWSIPSMRQYIETCADKRCYVSARGCDDIKVTPRGVAAGFTRPYKIVPNPSEFKVPSINKLGFTIWKGNIVSIA